MNQFYEINGSLEPTETYKWRQNKTVFVAAPNIRDAMALVEAKYPTITIHAVNKKGQIDLIAG